MKIRWDNVWIKTIVYCILAILLALVFGAQQMSFMYQRF